MEKKGLVKDRFISPQLEYLFFV